MNEENLKQIKLKNEEYLFDINTLFLPFASEYKTKKKNKDGTIENLIIDRITVQQADNIITVDGGTELGVPTLYDKKILFALQRMFIKQKKIQDTFNLINYADLDIDSIPPSVRTLEPVNVETIAREMGYKGNLSTSIKRKICDSIRRLNNATYRSQKNKIFIKEDESYLMSAETAIRLIDTYKIITFQKIEQERRLKARSKYSTSIEAHNAYNEIKNGVFSGSVKITLSPVIYKAMLCDQYLFYSLLNVNKIEDEVASTIYTLTIKWAGKNKTCTVKDEKFLQYIIMRENMADKYKIRKIRQSIDKLKETNLVTIVDLKNGVRTYDFRKDKKEKQHGYMLDKFNSMDEIIKGYVKLGIEESYIKNLFNEISNKLDFEKLRYLQALLRYATIRNSYKNSIDNIENFIKTYIEENIPIKEEYYNKPLMK